MSSSGSLHSSNGHYHGGFRRSRPNSIRRRHPRSPRRYSSSPHDGCESGRSLDSCDRDDAAPPPYNFSSSPGSSSAGSLDRNYDWAERGASQDSCGHCENVQLYTCTSFCFQLDTQGLLTASSATPNECLERDVQEFLRIINALMNDCGGAVCVHLSKPCSVTLFDSLVDHRLIAMIPNATQYDHNFERVMLDEYHVLYRVKPTSDSAISTLDFPSMLTHNHGLIQPSQQQIQKLVLGCFQTPTWTEGSEGDRNTGEFVYGKPVKLYPSCAVHFQSLDAAAVQRLQGNNFGEKVTEFWWNTLHLSQYVAALCKLQTGGSVYLGIEEERQQPIKKWKLVQGCDFGMLFPGSAKKLWEDIDDDSSSQDLRGQESSSSSSSSRGGSITKAVHHLAREEDVPCAAGRLTGRYICQGFDITPREREALKASLLRKVQSDMLWYPGYPSVDPVRVIFHPVKLRERPDNLCVVEVVVSKFHGLAFHNRRGPKAFKIILAIPGQEPQIGPLTLGEYMTQVSGYPLRGYDWRGETDA